MTNLPNTDYRIFQHFNWRLIDPDKFWVDLAIIHFIDIDGITLMWKSSFLEKNLKAFGNPRRFRKSFYNWCHTRDVSSIGFELYSEGLKNRKGIAYSQFYLAIKNEFSASCGLYPWPGKYQFLEYLQLPDIFVKTMLATEHGKVRFTRQDCNESYMRTGRRIMLNTRGNDKRSYGTRQEHRISLSLLGEVVSQLKEMDWPTFGKVDKAALPFFILPTTLLNEFTFELVKTYARWTQEILAQDSKRSLIEPERKMVQVLMQLLRTSYNVSDLKRSAIIWKDKFRKDTVGEDLHLSAIYD